MSPTFPKSTESIVFFFYLFIRIAGFFTTLPIFSGPLISSSVKIFFSLFLTALLSIVFYPEYFGETAIYQQMEWQTASNALILQIVLIAAKEFFVGYLLGICFSLLLESVRIAGELCSSAMALSSAQMVDPTSQISQTLFSQFFSIVFFLILFSFDFHHVFLITLKKSFSLIPIGNFSMSIEISQLINQGISRMYFHAIRFVMIPYGILFLVTIALGMMAKSVPQMNIFIVGFPVKIFMGLYMLFLSIKFFFPLIKKAFTEYAYLAEQFIYLSVR